MANKPLTVQYPCIFREDCKSIKKLESENERLDARLKGAELEVAERDIKITELESENITVKADLRQLLEDSIILQQGTNNDLEETQRENARLKARVKEWDTENTRLVKLNVKADRKLATVKDIVIKAILLSAGVSQIYQACIITDERESFRQFCIFGNLMKALVNVDLIADGDIWKAFGVGEGCPLTKEALADVK